MATVRRYQPYLYGASVNDRHALSLLASINAGDKHRTVQPLWSVSVRTRFEITERRDCIIKGSKAGGRAKPLEIDTEIGFLQARKTGLDPMLR